MEEELKREKSEVEELKRKLSKQLADYEAKLADYDRLKKQLEECQSLLEKQLAKG